MDNYIKLGKRYKAIRRISAVLAVVFVLLDILLPVKLWIKILLAVLIIIVFFFVSFRIDGLESNFLYTECNPVKYDCVCRIDHKSVAVLNDFAATAALGDFNRALALLQEKADMSAGNKFYKENVKLIYAECLFSSGNYDECLRVLMEYQHQFTDKDLKNNVYIINHNLYSFFGYYIKKEYDTCVSTLNTLNSDELKYNNLFKCKIDYYYAITYYYSGNTEKAKTYFEKIKDINDSLYYSKKAREYLENINKDKFLDMNFEEIPKYEKAALGAEADMEANSKQNKKAKLALLVIFVCVIIAALSLNTLLKTEYGTAEEVISSSMEFEADVKAMLPIENENASLCVFQNKEDLDYLYVAYLESYENGLYSYGINYDFLAGADGVYSSFSDAYNQKQNGEAFSAEKFAQALHKDEPFKETFDDYKYFFKSGKKDITVVFKIVRDKEQIPGGVHAESFSYTMENGNEKTYYIYVDDVIKENSAGYSAGIY